MPVSINYKTSPSKKNLNNVILFIDEKFTISKIKKYVSKNDFLLISDLLKTKNFDKEILSFEISSKKKIILISLTSHFEYNTIIKNIYKKLKYGSK